MHACSRCADPAAGVPAATAAATGARRTAAASCPWVPACGRARSCGSSDARGREAVLVVHLKYRPGARSEQRARRRAARRPSRRVALIEVRRRNETETAKTVSTQASALRRCAEIVPLAGEAIQQHPAPGQARLALLRRSCITLPVHLAESHASDRRRSYSKSRLRSPVQCFERGAGSVLSTSLPREPEFVPSDFQLQHSLGLYQSPWICLRAAMPR